MEIIAPKIEKVLLVTVKLYDDKDNWTLEDMSNEMKELLAACNVEVVETVNCNVDTPTPNYFIGKGKVEEIAMRVKDTDANTVVFSYDLTGTQQRNVEDVIGVKTIDRTQLILDIFAHRAHTPEGQMQVELAQLQYLKPRLMGKGLVLSRQGGGIGTSGPGEKKLEIDRRRIEEKVDRLKEGLKQVELHRETMRKRRKENAIPTVALVGYTSAGKSTLINALTGSEQVTASTLFTTLDPLSKSFKLENGENIILSDTVGFLHNLPHHLVEAFKATLEEVIEADLLIHVLDISHPKVYEHKEAVWKVLAELGVTEKKIVTAVNKIDLVQDKTLLNTMKIDFVNPVLISAKEKIGLNSLLEEIQKVFSDKIEQLNLKVSNTRMDLVNMFYKVGKVVEIKYLATCIKVTLNIPKTQLHKILNNKDIEIV